MNVTPAGLAVIGVGQLPDAFPVRFTLTVCEVTPSLTVTTTGDAVGPVLFARETVRTAGLVLDTVATTLLLPELAT